MFAGDVAFQFRVPVMELHKAMVMTRRHFVHLAGHASPISSDLGSNELQILPAGIFAGLDNLEVL